MSGMFRSPYESFSAEDKGSQAHDKDAMGEPLKKPSKTSAVGARKPNEGLEDVAHSATLNKHHDGSYSVETAEEGLTKHDDYNSASEHMSKSVGEGDNFGMGKEHQSAGSQPSKRAPHGPKDDMSGSGM